MRGQRERERKREKRRPVRSRSSLTRRPDATIYSARRHDRQTEGVEKKKKKDPQSCSAGISTRTPVGARKKKKGRAGLDWIGGLAVLRDLLTSRTHSSRVGGEEGEKKIIKKEKCPPRKGQKEGFLWFWSLRTASSGEATGKEEKI